MNWTLIIPIIPKYILKKIKFKILGRVKLHATIIIVYQEFNNGNQLKEQQMGEVFLNHGIIGDICTSSASSMLRPSHQAIKNTF